MPTPFEHPDLVWARLLDAVLGPSPGPADFTRLVVHEPPSLTPQPIREE
jgi:hypothetical protein